MSTYLLKPDLRCPHCGDGLDEHDGQSAEFRPSPGDISICWGCRALNVFVETPGGLGLREPSDAERERLESDPQVRAVLGACAESYDVASPVGLWRGR